jgi:hypothetical protein
LKGQHESDVDVVVMKLGSAGFVFPACPILSLREASPDGAGEERITGAPDARAPEMRREDLDAHLELSAFRHKHAPRPLDRCLLVKTGGVLVEFCTAGSLRIERLNRDVFWYLPKLLREAGCQAWVKGVATIDVELALQAPSLAVWIDLSLLAAHLVNIEQIQAHDAGRDIASAGHDRSCALPRAVT